MLYHFLNSPFTLTQTAELFQFSPQPIFFPSLPFLLACTVAHFNAGDSIGAEVEVEAFSSLRQLPLPPGLYFPALLCILPKSHYASLTLCAFPYTSAHTYPFLSQTLAPFETWNTSLAYSWIPFPNSCNSPILATSCQLPY